MLGFTKAAALLSLARASTFVIPGSEIPPANPVIEYHPENAFVKFAINGVDATERYPTFTFQVEGTSQACGESHILLNGLKLDSEWDGTTAHGRDYLDIYGGKEAEWYLHCLFDTESGEPSDESKHNSDDVVHVLSLRMGSHGDSVQPGFTISYKQMDRPAILRFQPQYHPFSLMGRPNVVKPWRTTSIEFDSEVSDSVQSNMSPQIYSSFAQGQKSLGTYLRTLKGSLTKEVQDVIKHFCPKHKAQAEQEKTTQHVAVPSNPLVESIQASHDESITTSESTDSTNTISNPPAAETRSLTALENLNPIEPPTSIPSFPPQNDHNLRLLKIFALVLTVGACFAWICLRCRDPRRRAECLARREERRNKKLYRRAARQHKVKMWFWNLRLKYGLAPSEILSWDEKRTRVIEQETILEHAMADDIRALRNAYRVVSNITAAEEGRNAFTYHSEYSERRRSVSTLPGYESEGTEPPTYEDISGSLEGTAVVDGFRYNPAETEFRSDSSVISTSPRISRDGTSSDFDEKFEPISLEATGPAGSGL